MPYDADLARTSNALLLNAVRRAQLTRGSVPVSGYANQAAARMKGAGADRISQEQAQLSRIGGVGSGYGAAGATSNLFNAAAELARDEAGGSMLSTLREPLMQSGQIYGAAGGIYKHLYMLEQQRRERERARRAAAIAGLLTVGGAAIGSIGGPWGAAAGAAAGGAVGQGLGGM